MRFRAGELEFNATVAESSERLSPRTGDQLRALTIQFRAQKVAMHEQALVEAKQRRSGGLFSLADADHSELEWRVRASTSSYVGTEPWGINHHVWRIEQVERIACSRLLLGAIALQPYEYAEEADDQGVLRLAARALISEADLAAVSLLYEDVEVVRVGISSAPRRMRLTYVWGERPEGRAIAVAAQDVREPRVTLRGVHTTDPDLVEDVLAMLRAKGILSESDADDLRRRRHAARHVAQIDGWPLSDEPTEIDSE